MGCGVALLFFIIGVCALAIAVPKLIRKGVAAAKNVFAEEQRLGAFERAWAPPSGSPDASWFPDKVDQWRLANQEPSTGVPRLFIEQPGRHATYRFGAEVLEVNVIPADYAEKEALFERAQSAQSGVGTVTTRIGNRGSLRLSGEGYIRFWWMPKGWFFVFRNHGGSDPKDFMEPYFKAMDGASTGAPQSPEPAPALK